MSFFKNLREELWPIKKEENFHFYTMSALMFCILFNQSILRILKDSILIAEVNAEITNFVKVYCVSPIAAIFVVIYAQMVNSLSLEKIFSYLILFFLAFFVLFAWVIYPNVELWHLDPAKMQELVYHYPYAKWYIAICEHWSFVVFYVFAEFWPNIFYILLFWQLANQTTTTEQAKRFYIRFSLLGNTAIVFVGFIIIALSSETSWISKQFSNGDAKVFLVQACTFLVVIFSFISLFLVRIIYPRISRNSKVSKAPKPKLGLKESFSYILSSKYLWLLVICSASFGLTMNLIEAIWKAKIKELYPNVNEYARFLSYSTLWTGASIIVMTVIGNNIIRYKNWFVSAVITPVLILVTGVMFFALIVFEQPVYSITSLFFATSPLFLAVMVGAIQNIIVKGTKYSIWDTTREMLYIPLDSELKTKGKAAVDLVSSKIGKSCSGFAQSLVLTIYPAATAITMAPLIMVFFLVASLLWIWAVKEIYGEYKKLLPQQNDLS
ncbi:ADP,ATP carrier protein [Candidatus Phycorickettsia trachydisci]|uniref:ADP,ATP carrier protein n=1 Tax=Candidatus Phycorickettsia trachydisci TaxID=2115978 RepID=A0A2P1P8A3_9RICK|nr:Npt1/Npt2 family nucleotide transporter [Candidatus Phycorickettsia trachydisci]AVP87484.1 ADP,ATP carrier protein [Candidatus Phycorickettsia trachydisci]